MTSFIEWLGSLCQDADPVKAGFQASWLYAVWNVFFPAAFGLTVAFLVRSLGKLFCSASGKETE